MIGQICYTKFAINFFIVYYVPKENNINVNVLNNFIKEKNTTYIPLKK